jgi:hypothetical protein
MRWGCVSQSYQRTIEGIGLTLPTAWNKFNDAQVPEKKKMSYLRLTNECNSLMSQLTTNSPCVLAMQDLTKRAERAGINVGNNNNNNNLILSEQEQIKGYLDTNRN